LCRVGVVEGEALLSYSFPPPHPFGSERVTRFWEELARRRLGVARVEPVRASDEEVEMFHEKEHVEFVRKASSMGGYLDVGDTPAFNGVFEAAEVVVGSTLSLVDKVLKGKIEHGFSPVGGLHHARPDRSAGFCVFNDIGVAIEVLRSTGVKRILYVDIDVHHGDGVFYPYENDPDVFIFDVHEDGSFIYPGTGDADETGKGKAEGTKVNLPLSPGEGDERIREILHKIEEFATWAKPEFVILQSGCDSLAGDPLGGLAFSHVYHGQVAKLLHEYAHSACDGKMVALGGGGYDPENCASGWASVVQSMGAKPGV